MTRRANLRAELVTNIEWNRIDLMARPGARERLERERGALSMRAKESGIVTSVGERRASRNDLQRARSMDEFETQAEHS
jgi:hypothetical protein